MKKIRNLAVVLLALFLTMNYSVFAEIPNNTVVIGDKAYDLKYVNKKENYNEIIEQFKKKQPIYVKTSTGIWLDNKTLSITSNEFIPRVTYKDENGKLTDYAEMDGEKIELKVTRCNYINENQVEIKFNNKLDKETALIKTNYIVNGKTLEEKDSVSIKEDLQTVVITLNEKLKDKDKRSILISKDIKDVNKNSMDKKFASNIFVLNKENYTYSSSTKIKDNVNIVANKETIKNTKIDGDVYISGDNVTLDTLTINGTLYIDPGKDGNANIKNVKAKDIVVLSGGENSIHLYNVNADTLDVSSDSKVRVESKGKTVVGNTIVHTYAIIDSVSGTFGEIRVSINTDEDGSKQQTVELRGQFSEPVILETEAVLKADKDAVVPKVEIAPKNKDAEIKLEGKFNEVEVTRETNLSIGKNSIITKSLKLKTQAQITADRNVQVALVEVETKNKDNEIKLNGSFKKVKVNKEAKLQLGKNTKVSNLEANANVILDGDKTAKISKIKASGKAKVEVAKNDSNDGSGNNEFKIPEVNGKDANTDNSSGLPNGSTSGGGSYHGGGDTIHRPQKPKSSDASLRDLKIYGKTINGFKSDKLSYNVELREGTEKAPMVAAINNNPKATVEITQAVDLPGQAKIVVTAEDGTVKTYIIKFTVKQVQQVEYKALIKPSFPGAFTSDFTLKNGDEVVKEYTLIYEMSSGEVELKPNNEGIITALSEIIIEDKIKVKIHGHKIEFDIDR